MARREEDWVHELREEMDPDYDRCAYDGTSTWDTSEWEPPEGCTHPYDEDEEDADQKPAADGTEAESDAPPGDS